MKKMAWGYGLAAAVALLAGQARAQSSATSTSTTGNTTDSSSPTLGSGSSSTGSDTGSTNTGTGSASGASASSSPSASGHFDAITGKVERFDHSSNELTLAGSDRKLKLDSTTKVRRDGSRASLDDIQEGDQVRASYSGSGDTLQVKSLDVTSAGAMGGSSSSMGTGSSQAGADDASGGSSTTAPKRAKKHAGPHGAGNAPAGNSMGTDSQ